MPRNRYEMSSPGRVRGAPHRRLGAHRVGSPAVWGSLRLVACWLALACSEPGAALQIEWEGGEPAGELQVCARLEEAGGERALPARHFDAADSIAFAFPEVEAGAGYRLHLDVCHAAAQPASQTACCAAGAEYRGVSERFRVGRGSGRGRARVRLVQAPPSPGVLVRDRAGSDWGGSRVDVADRCVSVAVRSPARTTHVGVAASPEGPFRVVAVPAAPSACDLGGGQVACHPLGDFDVCTGEPCATRWYDYGPCAPGDVHELVARGYREHALLEGPLEGPASVASVRWDQRGPRLDRAGADRQGEGPDAAAGRREPATIVRAGQPVVRSFAADEPLSGCRIEVEPLDRPAVEGPTPRFEAVALGNSSCEARYVVPGAAPRPADGRYAVYFVVTDAVGNSSRIEVAPFVIDTAAPDPPRLSRVEVRLGEAAGDAPCDSGSGAARAALGSEPLRCVRSGDTLVAVWQVEAGVTLDARVEGEAVPCASRGVDSFVCTLSPRGARLDGVVSIAALATDAAGNSQAAAPLLVEVDARPPRVASSRLLRVVGARPSDAPGAFAPFDPFGSDETPRVPAPVLARLEVRADRAVCRGAGCRRVARAFATPLTESGCGSPEQAELGLALPLRPADSLTSELTFERAVGDVPAGSHCLWAGLDPEQPLQLLGPRWTIERRPARARIDAARTRLQRSGGAAVLQVYASAAAPTAAGAIVAAAVGEAGAGGPRLTPVADSRRNATRVDLAEGFGALSAPPDFSIELPSGLVDVSVALVDAVGNVSPYERVERGQWVADLSAAGYRALSWDRAYPGTDPGVSGRPLAPGAGPAERVEAALGWQRLGEQEDGLPPARIEHALAYDPRRQRVVLFGGSRLVAPPVPLPLPLPVYEASSDTWEWDGRHWRRAAIDGASDSPAARREHALGFDEVAGRVVLFGGRGEGGNAFGDTWSWDGVSWRRLASAPAASACSAGQQPAPAPRFGHALAFHPGRGRLLLVGGLSGGGARSAPVPLGDSWEWDGARWLPLDEWRCEGGEWKRAPSDGALPPRALHAMGYSAADEALILFGGCNTACTRSEAQRIGSQSAYLGDSWALSAEGGWLPFGAPSRALSRAVHQLVVDPSDGAVYSLGGHDANGAVAAPLLRLEAGGWVVVPSPGAPGVEQKSVLDRARGQWVSFGGIAAGAAGAEPAAPGAAAPDSGMSSFYVFFVAGQRTVVAEPGGGASGEPAWLKGRSGLPARSRFAFAALPGAPSREEAVLVFGGTAGGPGAAELGDLWTFRGGAWHPIEPSCACAGAPTEGCGTAPAARRSAALAVSAASERELELILFGGVSRAPDGGLGRVYNDTWALRSRDGECFWWTELQPHDDALPAEGSAVQPGGRVGHGMARDAAGVLWLFGGSPGDTQKLADSWRYDPELEQWERQSLLGESPGPRRDFGLSSASHGVLLFGGFGDRVFGDTWLLDAQAARWREQRPGSSPPATRMGALVSLGREGPLLDLLVGGSQRNGSGERLTQQVWGWDGEQWHNVTPRVSPSREQPPARALHGLSYLPEAGEGLLFGGVGSFVDDEAMGDTWAFTLPQAASQTFDVDLSELLGVSGRPAAVEVESFLQCFSGEYAPGVGAQVWNGHGWQAVAHAGGQCPLRLSAGPLRQYALASRRLRTRLTAGWLETRSSQLLVDYRALQAP